MAVELKTEEIVTVHQTLAINEKIDDESKRPLGLACHAVIEEFEWDPDNPGHLLLQQLLRDIKNALGVRASRKTKDEPKKKRASKKAGSKKKKTGTKDEDETTVVNSSNGDSAPETEDVDASPPDEAQVSEGEPGGSEDQGSTDAGAQEETVAEIPDPFAVPPGSQAGA